MHIEKHLAVINACRFCFMCRHLAPVGNVTFRETDTPRGRALILDKVRMDRAHLANPDYIRVIYRAELSAACRFHCVNHYDETGLLLAARRDIVDAKLAPENVQALAAELQARPAPQWQGDADDFVYFVDPYTADHQPAIADAFRAILDGLGIRYRTLTGDTGKALMTLGYQDAAQKKAQSFRDVMSVSGCHTLVTSCPASLDALKNDYPNLGVAFTPDLRVLHTSEFLLELAEKGKLQKPSIKSSTLYCPASDFLKNYNARGDIPLKLLQKLGFSVARFGTNDEESYAVGEGAVIYDRLEPDIVKHMCARVVDRVQPPGVVVTVSPYTRYALEAFSPKQIPLLTLEELLAGRSAQCP